MNQNRLHLTLVALVLSSAAALAQVPLNNLIGHYTFEEGDTSNSAAAVQALPDGQLIGSPSIQNGKLILTGTANEYVDIANDGSTASLFNNLDSDWSAYVSFTSEVPMGERFFLFETGTSGQ